MLAFYGDLDNVSHSMDKLEPLIQLPFPGVLVGSRPVEAGPSSSPLFRGEEAGNAMPLPPSQEP